MKTVETRSNWAGNQTYNALRFHYPETLDQLRTIIIKSQKVRALGSRHSFNQIADTKEDLVSLENFNGIVKLDRERLTVCVEGGIRYGELSQFLHREGFALHNLASLPHISVAGACATATHGSGVEQGNLATAVSAMEIMKADGELAVLSREENPEEFEGAVVGLGGLGVVTKLTLDIRPTFEIAQYVFENLPFDAIETHFEEIISSTYSVSLFTSWQKLKFEQVWFKHRADKPFIAPELFGATAATEDLHPLRGLPVVNCTPQMGIPGPWHERFPHFRMEFTPSNGEELQSEYIVPSQYAVAALRAIEEISDQIAPLLQISEIRAVAADNLWMSPCYHQPCVGIHFTWLKNWTAVSQLLPLIEGKLTPFGARPHWGKLFTLSSAQIPLLYPKLPEFKQLLLTYDPSGKFCNSFLDSYIFGKS